MGKLNVDKAKAIELVKKDAYVLEDLPDEFKNDYEVVRLAVSLKPYSFGSASEMLRNNAELAIMAISGNHNTMRYVGRQLQNNIGFLKDAYVANKKIADFIQDRQLKNQLERR